MTRQYFINYNLDKGWYLSSSPIITANWKASNGNVWVVPVGGGVGRVFRLGFQPVNVTASSMGMLCTRFSARPGACDYKKLSCSQIASGDEEKAHRIAAEVEQQIIETFITLKFDCRHSR